jgi:hypothetical protein
MLPVGDDDGAVPGGDDPTVAPPAQGAIDSLAACADPRGEFGLAELDGYLDA